MDDSEIAVGDKLNTRLFNRFPIKGFVSEADGGPKIIVYAPGGDGAIDHLVSVTQTISGRLKYPEIVVYGTSESGHNYDGVYHIIGTDGYSSPLLTIKLYKRANYVEPLYNDYVGETNGALDMGFAHIPWPTHKYLLLWLANGSYYKAYMDAPVDTIYDNGDKLNQYDRVARNVSILNSAMFPGWSEFDQFKRQSRLNESSDVLELTSMIPGAQFGSFFPSKCLSK